MLYVVKTDTGGRVRAMWPCDNGIDQALDLIANALTYPEDDPAANYDVVTNWWQEAVRVAAEEGGDAHELFVAARDRLSAFRYGLAVMPEREDDKDRRDAISELILAAVGMWLDPDAADELTDAIMAVDRP